MTTVTKEQGLALAKALGATSSQMAKVSAGFDNTNQSGSSGSSGSSTKGTNILGQTAPIGANEQVSSSNIGSVLNYLSPYMTSSAQQNIGSLQNTLTQGTQNFTQPFDVKNIQNVPYTPPTPPTADTTSPFTNAYNFSLGALTDVGASGMLGEDGGKKDVMDYFNEAYQPDEGFQQQLLKQKQEALKPFETAVQDLKAQITGIQAQRDAQQLAVVGQGRGIPQDLLNTQMAKIDRNAAIKLLPLTAQYQAELGRLESAEKNLTELYGAIVADRQAEREYKQAQFQFAYKVATDQQDRALKAQEMQTKEKWREEDRQFEYQMQLSKLFSDAGDFKNAGNVMNPNLTSAELAGYATQVKDMTGGGMWGAGLSATSQAIIENPNLFSSLTATEKGKVINELSANGYDTTSLGTKALSTGELNKISETQRALSDIKVLTESIDSNLKYIGPVSGLQALNPWSKARQLQADIDRIKQTIGKALEGGVLRKEDEEKYKKILPTINDTEETARYKLAQLNTTLQADLDRYTSLLQSGGRSIDVNAPIVKKGSTITGTSTSGNSYVITKE